MKKTVLSTAVCVASMLFVATAAQAADLGMPKHPPTVLHMKCDASGDCHASNLPSYPGEIAYLLGGEGSSGAYSMNEHAAVAHCYGGNSCVIVYLYHRTAKNGQNTQLSLSILADSNFVTIPYLPAGSWTGSDGRYDCYGAVASQCSYQVSIFHWNNKK